MHNPEEYKFYAFDFQKLELDKFQSWYLHILVKGTAEEFDRKYTLLLRYDTEKLENIISSLEDERAIEIGNIKSTLFDNDQEIEKLTMEIRKTYDEKIANAEVRLENTKRQNKDFVFGGLIKKVEYKGTGVLLVIGISDDDFVPRRINELKEILHNYKVAILDRDGHKNE